MRDYIQAVKATLAAFRGDADNEIRDFLLDQGVAKVYVPERLEVIEEMPMTPTGKVQKFALREVAQSFVTE